MVYASGVSRNWNQTFIKKEETMLTTERARTINSREPNMTRMILLRLNTAYALEPHTATCKKERGKWRSKQL